MAVIAANDVELKARIIEFMLGEPLQKPASLGVCGVYNPKTGEHILMPPGMLPPSGCDFGLWWRLRLAFKRAWYRAGILLGVQP